MLQVERRPPTPNNTTYPAVAATAAAAPAQEEHRQFALKVCARSRLQRVRRPGGKSGLHDWAREVTIHRRLYHRHVALLFEVRKISSSTPYFLA